MPGDRYILVGPPRVGKSTYARALRALGIATLCADPAPLVKQSEDGVEYLPAIFAEPGMWSEASDFIAREWLTREGPFCLEGVAMARALRKWLRTAPAGLMPAEHVVVFTEPMARQSPGQAAMSKAVATVWSQVHGRLRNVAERPCDLLMGRPACACLRGGDHRLR